MIVWRYFSVLSGVEVLTTASSVSSLLRTLGLPRQWQLSQRCQIINGDGQTSNVGAMLEDTVRRDFTPMNPRRPGRDSSAHGRAIHSHGRRPKRVMDGPIGEPQALPLFSWEHLVPPRCATVSGRVSRTGTESDAAGGCFLPRFQHEHAHAPQQMRTSSRPAFGTFSVQAF